MCSTAYFCEPFGVSTALALVFGIPVIPRIRSLNPLFRPNDVIRRHRLRYVFINNHFVFEVPKNFF